MIDRKVYIEDDTEFPYLVQQIFSAIDSFILLYDKKVLDLACGNGKYAREFWMRQAKVVCVDFVDR